MPCTPFFLVSSSSSSLELSSSCELLLSSSTGWFLLPPPLLTGFASSSLSSLSLSGCASLHHGLVPPASTSPHRLRLLLTLLALTVRVRLPPPRAGSSCLHLSSPASPPPHSPRSHCQGAPPSTTGWFLLPPPLLTGFASSSLSSLSLSGCASL